MMAYLVLGQVYCSLLNAGLRNGLHKQTRATDEELVINSKPSLIFREDDEVGPERSRSALDICNGDDKGPLSHLTTGMPVTLDSRNAVYQMGSML